MKRLLCLLLCLMILAGCSTTCPADPPAVSIPPAQSADVSLPEPEPEPEPTVARLMVAGDVMSHMPITNDAYVEATGEYDYSHMMAEAAQQLALADYAVGKTVDELKNGAVRT